MKLFSASETSTVSGTTISSATSAVKRIELPKDNDDTKGPDTNDQDKKEVEDGELKTEVGFEGDVDTMKDLRKTFAGIFG